MYQVPGDSKQRSCTHLLYTLSNLWVSSKLAVIDTVDAALPRETADCSRPRFIIAGSFIVNLRAALTRERPFDPSRMFQAKTIRVLQRAGP